MEEEDVEEVDVERFAFTWGTVAAVAAVAVANVATSVESLETGLEDPLRLVSAISDALHSVMIAEISNLCHAFLSNQHRRWR